MFASIFFSLYLFVTQICILCQVNEEDVNYDGRKDLLKLTAELPLLDTENVYGFRMLLFFNYELKVSRETNISCVD